MVQKKKINYIELLCSIAVLAFCEWFFFRNIMGNNMLFGDNGDGRLTMLLTEHWWKFFQGKEKFSEIAMFYPEEGVIGYTDMFLGYGLVYSVMRLFGVNMFYAYKYTLIFVHILGTVSMYYLMRRKLKCNTWWSLFGTMAFCFSNTYAVHLGHTQLDAISNLPILLILLMGFIEKYDVRKKRNIYAFLCIAWFVLLTYNSWYIACFTGLFALIFLIIYIICLIKNSIDFFGDLKIKLLAAWKDIICYILFMVILYIPFIMIYVPIMKQSSGYSYSICVEYLPEFADLLNVTENNWMLGGLISRLGLSERGYSDEVTEGFSIVLLLMFMVVLLAHARSARKCEYAGEDSSVRVKKYQQTLITAILASVVVSILLVMRLSSNGVSLWYIVYTLVPVVRSMRAVARFLLWLSFPMSVITAYLANKYLKFNWKEDTVFSLVVLCLLFASNVNKTGVHAAWNATDEMAFIDNVAVPPSDAEAFYIIDTSTSGKAWIDYQLSAFEIATVFDLKTINGYSGQFPPGWGGITYVDSSTYEYDVASWMDGYDMTNVYVYDYGTNEWIQYDVRNESKIDSVFSPEENRYSLSSGLEDHNQGVHCWTGQNFKVTIANDKIKENGMLVKLNTFISRYRLQNPELDPYVQLWVDGQYIQDIVVNDELQEILVDMSWHDSDKYVVELKTNCYFCPNDIGESIDPRNLSLALYYIGDNRN